MAYALTCTIHLNVNANQVLQEMGTHALVSLYKTCRNCQQLIRIFSHSFMFCFHQNCIDIDECTTQGHDCSADGVCTNVEGSFQCACEPGFTGDGKTCSGRLWCSYTLSAIT